MEQHCATFIRGLGIAVVHEILALGTDVRLIQSLLKFNEYKRIESMTVNDLPQELLSRIREQFYATPKIRQMEVTRQMYIRNGNLTAALALAQDIDALYNKCVYEYIEENKEQVERIDVADMDMPIEEKEEMMKLLLVCFMCADIIKSSIQDMDSILYRHDKTLKMEMFNDIRQLMEMSEAKLQYLQKNSGYLRDLVWGEKCDNMYEVIKSKAASIMRKRKNDPNWGDNTKKFY